MAMLVLCGQDLDEATDVIAWKISASKLIKDGIHGAMLLALLPSAIKLSAPLKVEVIADGKPMLGKPLVLAQIPVFLAEEASVEESHTNFLPPLPRKRGKHGQPTSRPSSIGVDPVSPSFRKFMRLRKHVEHVIQGDTLYKWESSHPFTPRHIISVNIAKNS